MLEAQGNAVISRGKRTSMLSCTCFPAAHVDSPSQETLLSILMPQIPK